MYFSSVSHPKGWGTVRDGNLAPAARTSVGIGDRWLTKKGGRGGRSYGPPPALAAWRVTVPYEFGSSGRSREKVGCRSVDRRAFVRMGHVVTRCVPVGCDCLQKTLATVAADQPAIQADRIRADSRHILSNRSRNEFSRRQVEAGRPRCSNCGRGVVHGVAHHGADFGSCAPGSGRFWDLIFVRRGNERVLFTPCGARPMR
jgi:hypothetical protein